MGPVLRAVKKPEFAIPAAQLTDVHRVYRSGEVTTPVLRGVDLALPGGALQVILGASGSGKTTLLNIIGAIDHADSGEVVVDGVNLRSAGARELRDFRRNRVGFIFQFYNLMPTLNACENAEVALEHQPLTRTQRRVRAEEMLAQVGLGDHRHKFPAQMSGGEQQRVAIARALVRRPRLLLCDEPTGNLDGESGQRVVQLIDELRRELDTTVVVVTHNPELFPHADQVARIIDGRMV